MAKEAPEKKLPMERSLPMDRIDPAAVAAAEAAKARIQSAYLYAMHNPRDFDQARDKILNACKRPAFADKVEYSKPVGGKKIKGPSVRFAELAIREWGNVLTETTIVYEDEKVRRLHILCIDLETNAQHGQEISIAKTVERKKPAEDREIMGERTNTRGEKVYILSATEDELFNKQNAMISKIKRNEGLRLIPTDIIDEAVETATKTIRDADAKDPAAAKKKILDSFSELGIKPISLQQYLKHPLDTLVPAELEDLRNVYRAIKDGEATWKDYLEKGEGGAGAEKEEEATPSGDEIKKFDEMVNEKKVDRQVFDPWLKNLADANEMTIDALKADVVRADESSQGEFWDQYTKFASMASKGNKGGLFGKK